MTGGPIINEPAPYALLYVHGAPVRLTRAQFEQAARDGALCHCSACVACTARDYTRELARSNRALAEWEKRTARERAEREEQIRLTQ